MTTQYPMQCNAASKIMTRQSSSLANDARRKANHLKAVFRFLKVDHVFNKRVRVSERVLQPQELGHCVIYSFFSS